MQGNFHSMEPIGFSMDQVVGRPLRAHWRTRNAIVRATSSASRAAGRLHGPATGCVEVRVLTRLFNMT